jgi:hypothetical protein
MQDQPIKFALPNGSFIVRDEAPAGELPPAFVAELARADAVLVIGSSETKALSMRPIIAGGEYQPEQVASHALVAAIVADFDNLVRAVKGEPTDAQRFDALRQFTLMPQADCERFERINGMMQQYEEDNPQAGESPTQAEFERYADFLVHALIETAPLVVEQRSAAN